MNSFLSYKTISVVSDRIACPALAQKPTQKDDVEPITNLPFIIQVPSCIRHLYVVSHLVLFHGLQERCIFVVKVSVYCLDHFGGGDFASSPWSRDWSCCLHHKIFPLLLIKKCI